MLSEVDVVLSVSPRYRSSTIGDNLGLFPIPLPCVDTLDGLDCPDTMDLPDLKCIKTLSKVYKLNFFSMLLKCNFKFLSLFFLHNLNLLWFSFYGYGCTILLCGFMVIAFFLWFLCCFYSFYGCFCLVFFMVFMWVWIAIWILF